LGEPYISLQKRKGGGITPPPLLKRGLDYFNFNAMRSPCILGKDLPASLFFSAMRYKAQGFPSKRVIPPTGDLIERKGKPFPRMQGLFFSCTPGCIMRQTTHRLFFSCNEISLWKVLVQKRKGGGVTLEEGKL
jgi:hypothetical protein